MSPIIYPTKIPIYNTQPGAQKNKNKEAQNDLYYAPSGRKEKKSVAFGEYEKKIDDWNKLVVRHEEAHQTGLGPQIIGKPVYETQKDIGGKSLIRRGYNQVLLPPAFTKNSPLKKVEEVITAAKYVISGSEAPASFSPLSKEDKEMAFKGRRILSQAEITKSQKINRAEKQQHTTSGQNLNLIG